MGSHGLGAKLPIGLAALLLLAALALPTPAPAQSRMEIYRVQHRTPSELAELVRGLMGRRGSASPDDQSGVLILHGEGQDLAHVLAVLKKLDVQPAQYRLHLRMTHADALAEGGAEVEGWLAVGDLRVGRRAAEPPGGRVVFRSADTSDRSQVDSSLVILEGRHAELWTGSDLLVPVREFDVGTRVQVEETTAVVPVRTGLRVMALRRGEDLELQLTPISRRLDAGEVRVMGAMTQVRIRPGEALVIAGTRQLDDARSEGLVGASKSAVTHEHWMEVRIEPLDPPATPPAGPR